jgi:carboxyl-terminal processing protease
MRALRLLLYAALIVATLAVTFSTGYGAHWLLSRSPTVTATTDESAAAEQRPLPLGPFWEAWHILEKEFYGEHPSEQARTYGAVKGMVDTYADPYTVFIEPQPRQREKEDLSGEFGGIGAWVSQDEDGTIRLKPMVDRAAEKAGLVDRDILKAVDDVQITPEMTTDDVVSLIRGPIGEPVTVTIYRESNSATLAIEVIRERIETPSVEWRILEENTQVGYLAINLFSERTAKELDRALDDLREQGATQLILDLRHNPGGLLQGAVDVASRFLSNGVVLFERKSDGSETTYRVVNAQRVADWPMAILVDGATASASEIVAGALQDRGRAKLVGEKTFGKGSVQFVHDLSDGSSIHVTVAHWLTPNGHEINGIGLTPDVEAPQVEDGDAPLDAALRLLNP